jgi:dimeric dUTPase (all-alpha-NTP-PPase superfamily)
LVLWVAWVAASSISEVLLSLKVEMFSLAMDVASRTVCFSLVQDVKMSTREVINRELKNGIFFIILNLVNVDFWH